MKNTPRLPSVCAAALIALAMVWSIDPCPAAPPKAGQWEAAGTLLEACTCAVPCTCNFGEPPSPNAYCYSAYAYRLAKASWDGVDLSGLVVAGSDGPKGVSVFLDERATPLQRPALQHIAYALFAQGGPRNVETLPFASEKITCSVSGTDIALKIGDVGGFTAHVIVGRDGKSPVVVENNTVWPIARAIKGKTSALDINDKTAGVFHTTGTNSNYGEFAFSGSITDIKHGQKSGDASCCSGKAGGVKKK